MSTLRDYLQAVDGCVDKLQLRPIVDKFLSAVEVFDRSFSNIELQPMLCAVLTNVQQVCQDDASFLTTFFAMSCRMQNQAMVFLTYTCKITLSAMKMLLCNTRQLDAAQRIDWLGVHITFVHAMCIILQASACACGQQQIRILVLAICWLIYLL